MSIYDFYSKFYPSAFKREPSYDAPLTTEARKYIDEIKEMLPELEEVRDGYYEIIDEVDDATRNYINKQLDNIEHILNNISKVLNEYDKIPDRVIRKISNAEKMSQWLVI
jgi:uncharacterized coiled-coil DUF342 family protein